MGIRALNVVATSAITICFVFPNLMKNQINQQNENLAHLTVTKSNAILKNRKG